MATDLLNCYNKGCGLKFEVSKNNNDACMFHPGVPVFHDALKGWSCCKKRSTDFTEFLNFPGCTNGPHSNEKPKEPEKPKPEPKIDNDVKKEEAAAKLMFQREQAPSEEKPRPSWYEPLVRLQPTVAASLQKALDKRLQEMSLNTDTADGPAKETSVQVGTSCKNSACKTTYQSPDTDREKCQYHPGVAVFHEGMKFWSCCNRKTSDFQNFLDQAGCETGSHLWVKEETADSKKACRMDWFQTSPAVNISVFSKLTVPEKTYIEVNEVRCKIHIVFDAGKSVYENDITLRNPIIPEQSKVNLMGSKVEIVLKKAESFSWPSLELKKEQQNTENTESD